MFSVDYYIGKFGAIPHGQWTTGDWDKGDGTKCAMGHVGDTSESSELSKELRNPEAVELENLFKTYLGLSVIQVNDWDSCEIDYPQTHPKERIMEALADIKRIQAEDERIKKMMEPKKVKTVYVTVPENFKEEVKEIVEEAILS